MLIMAKESMHRFDTSPAETVEERLKEVARILEKTEGKFIGVSHGWHGQGIRVDAEFIPVDLNRLTKDGIAAVKQALARKEESDERLIGNPFDFSPDAYYATPVFDDDLTYVGRRLSNSNEGRLEVRINDEQIALEYGPETDEPKMYRILGKKFDKESFDKFIVGAEALVAAAKEKHGPANKRTFPEALVQLLKQD